MTEQSAAYQADRLDLAQRVAAYFRVRPVEELLVNPNFFHCDYCRGVGCLVCGEPTETPRTVEGEA